MDADRDPVEKLAEEFLERRRQGEEPTIEEYAARYPELADGIREIFPAPVKRVPDSAQAHPLRVFSGERGYV